MILIVVKFRPRPEHVDEWLSLMEPLTHGTRAEPGNVGFEWFRHSEDPGVYLLVEGFVDGAAGAAHVSTEHFRTAIDRLPDLLLETPEIINVEVPDGWSAMSEIAVPPAG